MILVEMHTEGSMKAFTKICTKIASLITIWSCGSRSGKASFRLNVREDSPQARNFLTIQREVAAGKNCRWWFGRSVLLQVSLRLGSCCYLSTTLEKLSCSRSNPLSRVSLRSADANLSNLLLLSPAVQSRARTRHV